MLCGEERDASEERRCCNYCVVTTCDTCRRRGAEWRAHQRRKGGREQGIVERGKLEQDRGIDVVNK